MHPWDFAWIALFGDDYLNTLLDEYLNLDDELTDRMMVMIGQLYIHY